MPKKSEKMMRPTFNVLMVMIMLTTNVQISNMSAPKEPDIRVKNVFAHKQNADLYWQALIYAANGNKDAAVEIAAALQSDVPPFAAIFRKENDSHAIDALFDKLFLDSVSHEPQVLSQLGLLESVGIRDHNAFLDDVSVARYKERLEKAKENYVLLKGHAPHDLSQAQKTSYDIFLWQLNHEVAGEPFVLHDYKIHQLDGILMMLGVTLTYFHKLETAKDVELYCARLGAIPKQFDQLIALLTTQEEMGIVLPRCAIEKVLMTLERSTPEAVEKSLFYEHLQEKIEALHLENRDALLAKTHQIIEQAVYPAYRKLQTHFAQLRDHTQASNGVWALPDGEAYYAYMLQHHTTTDLTADEVHALGLKEVAKIHAQMRQILASEGLDDPKKEVGAIMQELKKDPRFYYPNTDAGRAECLADFGRILERSRKELSPLFGIKPSMGVTIQRVPVHEEAGSAGAYYCQPSIDGSRPGMFFANLRDMAEMPKYSMETLTIHEAEPGHHFQLALQNSMNIPVLRKLGPYNAFYEGWALYTEKLAYEHDFYSSSFSRLGHLKDELMRAARLVVDTGLHHKRWTREQAIDYMEAMTGIHRNAVTSEIDRYLVMPGQACSYKIGQLKILELRERAKAMLGEKFDIREFHDVILSLAAAPLAVLEKVIDGYIADKLAA